MDYLQKESEQVNHFEEAYKSGYISTDILRVLTSLQTTFASQVLVDREQSVEAVYQNLLEALCIYILSKLLYHLEYRLQFLQIPGSTFQRQRIQMLRKCLRDQTD